MDNRLYHAGVKGQKWGRRRYQNPDGTLTPEGKKRYSSKSGKKETSNNSSDSEPSAKPKTSKTKTRKALEIGSSVCAGLLSGSLGSAAVFTITGSGTIAKLVAPSLAAIGGMSYYQLLQR